MNHHSVSRPRAITLAELWMIQESLLQAYRTIFIAVESAVFALTTALLVLNRSWVAAPLVLLGLALIVPWKAVCNARARAVTFVHWMIQRYEEGEEIDQPYSRFREFQDNRKYGDLDVLKDEKFRALSRSKTRQRMDSDIPHVFIGLWISLILLALLVR